MATIQERLEAMRNGAPPVGKMSVSKTDDINTRLNAMRQDGAKFQNPLMDLAREKVAQNSNGYVSMADLNRESNGAGTEVQRKAPVDLGMPAIIAPKDMTPTMPHHSGKFDEPSTPGWRYGEIADDAQRYAAAMTPTSDMYLNPYTADAASFMQSEADKALADAAYYREKENSENKALEDQRKTTNQAFRAVDTFTPLESGAWINSPEQYDTAQKMYDQAAAEDAKLKAMGGRAARELPLTVPKNFFAGVVGAARGLVNEAGYIAQGATKAQMDENAEMWRRMGREDYARDMEKARDAQGDMQNWAQFGQPYISSVAEETAGYGKGGQILGNVAQGVGGMVPSILSNLAVPGSGLPVMFFQASGNATEEAKAAGASDEAAALYGTAVGAVEVLTEKMFGGIPGLNIGALDEGIENIIKQKVGNEATQRAIMFLVDALGEGVEEFTSEFGDYFLDKWLVKHDDRSLNEVGKDALYSFLIGALTSVAMQAPAEVANMAKTRRGREQLAQIVADQVEQQIEQPDAAQNATQPAVNEPLMQLAQEMATDKITAARDAELRAQETAQAQAAMTAQNAQTMQTAIPAQQTAPAAEIQPQNAPAAAQETSERQTAPATQAEKTPVQAQKKPAARVNNPGFVQDAVSDRAKLTYTQKRALDTIGKALGVRVRMVESITATDADGNVRQSGAQGYYKNGEIVLARDADDPYLTTAVHESVHRIRELSEGDYSYLAGFVQRNMSDPKYKLAELIKGMEGYTAENIPEEIVADAFGRMLGDEQTMRQFVAENSTAAQRIMDVFAEIFDRIRQALTGGNVKTLTENQRKVYEDLAGRMDVMMKYYRDAVENVRESEGESANPKFSRSDREAADAVMAQKDSTGQPLSKGQAEYFHDSKVRDEDGNLKRMYHGTSNAGFTKFDRYFARFGLFGNGYYFTDNRDVAESYTQKGKGKNPGVYEVYLNITNPIDMDAKADTAAWRKILAPDGGDDYISDGMTNEQAFRALKEFCEDEGMYKYDAEDYIEEIIRGMGFDGITHIGGGRYGAKDGPRHRVYIAFDQEQAKLASNQNPTDDPDIRYSTSDRDSTEAVMAKRDADYAAAVERGDTETAQHMVDEAAERAMPESKVRKPDGKLMPVYHGTKADFTVFDTKGHGGANGTAEGYGIYLTDMPIVASAYGDRKIAGYADVKRPAYGDRKTIKRSELARLVKAICLQEAQRMVEEDDYASVKEALPDTWVSNYVYTPDYPSMSAVYSDVADQLLRQEDNDADVVYEIMNALGIRDYERAMDFYHDILTPTTGIDGIWQKWKVGKQGADANIILAFSSDQIKSNEPVTYDDNGNIIPLSERFNTGNEDIRYSKSDRDIIEKVMEDTGKVYNRTVILKEDTVDKYLNDYAAKSSPKYAQAYIAYMTPDKFLDLTTTSAGRSRIANETEPLDLEKLKSANVDQPIQLSIDHETGEVTGHEGRHRMKALMRVGVENIPVLLFDRSNKYSKTAIDKLVLKGQFDNRAFATVRDMQPLSYENRDAVIQKVATQPTTERLQEKYNGRETVQYSTSDRELLDEYIKAHGAIKTGENPTRDITMPKRTTPKTKVSMTVRTVAEAGATPDEFIPTIENLAANHEFDYTPYSDKKAIADADRAAATKGWQTALTDWVKDVSRGEVSKRNTALGWALYNNAVNAGDTETALLVLRNIVQHQRNAAQAVQATRILKQLNPETQLYNTERTVESLNDELKKKYGDKVPNLEIDPDLAERFLKAKTPEARDKAMKDIYRDIGRQMPTRFIDRWNAWRYLAMLGNPRTHIRNIVGNAGFAPVVAAKNLTATAIESAVNLVSGGKIERTKGNIIGRGDLLKAAWNDYENVRDEALGEAKLNDSAMAKKEIQEGRRIFGNTKSKAWNKTGGAALERVYRANGTALDAEDVWFSKPHYTLALAQYCAANGITAEQISKGQGLARAREYAFLEAQKATYRDTNDFSQAISRLGRGAQWSNNKVTRAISTVFEGILPFRKTPANILARGVEYSPLGLMKSLTYDLAQVKKGNMTAADMIDNLSAGLTGTGLVALGAYLVSQGLLRGRGGSDDKKKDFDKLTGHQNYALELPNGTSITLDWLAPEALPLFIGANLAEIAKENNGNMKLADILTAVGNVTEPMLEMSCLQSLNNIFQAVGYAKEGDMNALTSALSSAATSYLTQALPTLLGQVERTGEGKRMTTYTDKNDFLTGDIQYTLGKASARLPVWDYHQIPYIDAWGREELTGKPIARGFNNFFNPSFVSKINESDMEKELERLYDSTGENVFPQRAPKYFNVDGERKDLTAGEYLKYATAKGQTSYAVVGGMTSSSIYENMTDAEKAACVEDAYSYANQTARTTVGGKVSDSWVEKAQTGVKHGIAPETYIMLRNITGDIDSLKDKNGDTISNSKGLQIMEKIYSIPGLNDEQRQYLFESFGVGKTILHYNKAAVSEKLSQMRKQ